MKPLVLILEWMPEAPQQRLHAEFDGLSFAVARSPESVAKLLPDAVVTYGLPPLNRIPLASSLLWIQLISAGVPQELCPVALEHQWLVTNLAGLYGPSIAEHALALMLMLKRKLHQVVRQQQECRWDRTVRDTMADVHGRTLAVLGLGNIGRAIARLGRALGMRVVGCRRTGRWTPGVDRIYPREELCAMLAEADVLAVAAPLTAQTTGMLGPAEFAALKPGAVYVNVSRGPIAQEAALLEALRSGRLAGAGLDVFAVEPLPPEHPFWNMPQVIVSPHYSGETVNLSALPAERFLRNLHSWTQQKPLEGVVDLAEGY